MRTVVCTVAVALLAVHAEGATYTETCSTLAAQYHFKIKESITSVNLALAEAKTRMTQEMNLVSDAVDLSFVEPTLNDIMNYTGEFSNQLGGGVDVAMSTITAALPYGLSLMCQVDTTSFDMYLTLSVNATGAVAETFSLAGLPAADLAGLGIAFTNPSASLSGSVLLAGTIAIHVRTSDAVITVSDLSATVTGTANVDTKVTWKDINAEVDIAGEVVVSDVTIPIVFPTSTDLDDFEAKIAEVRLGTLAGKMAGTLTVTLPETPVGQLPSPVLMFVDEDMFDAVLPVVTVDADISDLESTFVEVLRQLGEFDIDLSSLGLSGLELPGVDVTELIRGVPDMLKLAPVAEQYFLLFVGDASFPTFEGLAAFIKDNMPVPQLTTSVDLDGINVTAGWFPELGEMGVNLRLELGSTLASQDFGGTVTSVLGAMDELKSVFELIGASAPDSAMAVPDFSASISFSGSVVLDVTVGLKTDFINTGTLTSAGLAGNAFLRVNDISAEVLLTLDPINFEIDLLLSQFVVRDGAFEVALGIRADFNAVVDEDALGAAVTASTVAAVTEITVLELLSGGTSAVLDFVKQLSLEVYATLDVMIPVELTAGYSGTDLSISPIIELHDDTLLSGGLPSFSLDIDLSFLVPSLPGSVGGSVNHLEPVIGSLTDMLDGIAGLSLDTVSIPNMQKIPDLLSALAGKVNFTQVLAEYSDLIAKFRELANGLGLDMTLDTVGAIALAKTDAFNLDILGRLQARFPTVFPTANYSALVNSATGISFLAENHLTYFQVEFGLASTIASSNASFSYDEMIWFLSVNADFSLTKENAWALVNLLGLTGYTAHSSTGFPVDSSDVLFNPANFLSSLKTALGLDSLTTFNLATLGNYVANSVPTLGVNVDFNIAMFDLLVQKYPDFATKYANVTVGDLLPMSLTTGKQFDWRNYLTEVGDVLGLGTTNINVASIANLFGKRPTLMGLVRFIKSRLLNGMSTGLTISGTGTTFSADLITTDGKWEFTAQLGLDFNTGALKPTQIIDALQDTLSGLLDAIGADSLISSLGDIGSDLVSRLDGLDDFLTFSAAAQVGVEAGIDIKPLLSGGSPQMYLRITQFNMSVSAAIANFAPTMDFGGSFVFKSVINGDLVFSAVAADTNSSNPIVLLDQAAGVSFTIAPLSSAITFGGSIVAEVELDEGGLPSSLFLGVEDLALLDSTPPKFTVDAEIPQALMKVVRDGLVAMGDVGREVNGFEALTTTLPLMNRSLHDVLKTGETGPDWGDFLIWDTVLDQLFEDPLYAGCLDGSTDCPRARETVTLFTEAMANLTQGSFTSDSGVPASFVNGGMIGDSFELAFGLNGNLEVLVTPPLAELIDDDDFDFTGTGLLTVGINFGFGFEIKVNTAGGIASVTTDDIVLKLDNFTMGLTIAADVTATASIGVLSASVDGGTGVLAAEFGGSLNGGAALALADVTGSNFAFTKTATLDACLPFSASVGTQDLGELAGGDADNKPQICVNDDNLFDSTAPVVSTHYMNRFFDFRGMSPIQIMGIVRGLINVVQEYRESAVFDLELPFTDVDVGDMLDFTDTLTAALSNKMVKVQDAADRTTLILCLTGATLTEGWNVDGTNASIHFDGNASSKVMSLVLNEELEVEVPVNDTLLSATTTIDEIVVLLNSELYRAGLGLSVAASVPEGGGDSLQLCTNESIKATDLRVKIAQKQTGNTAYNESADEVSATTYLGFANGDIKEAPRVASFSSIPELVIVLAEAIGIPSDTLSYTYKPSLGDPDQYELLFALDLTIALPTPMTSLLLGAEVEPLFSVNASAEIELSTDVNIKFEIGARMGATPGNLSVSANIPADQEYANFTLASEQNFTVILDKVSHVVVLRANEEFYTELETQIAALSATLDSGKTILTRNYQDTTFLIITMGIRRLEVVTTAAFEALTGLASDKSKAVIFTPCVRNLHFDADMVLTVSEINLAATLAVLEAEAYAGSGYISIQAAADFGGIDTTTLLSDLRDAIIEDPFSQISATATVGASLDVDVSVRIPSLGSISGGVAIAVVPTEGHAGFFIDLKENFTAPNSSDFEVTITGADIPNFKNLTLTDIIGLVSDGVDLLFGNSAADPVVEGLLSDLPLLDVEIPLIAFTPRTMISAIQTALGTLESLLANQTGSVERVELLIEEALGLSDDNDPDCTGSCLVEFTFANSKLILAVQYEATPTLPTLSFDMNLLDMMSFAGIDLPQNIQDVLGDFIDLEANIVISLSGGASAKLELGVDMSTTPFRVFIGAGTALQVNVLASASGDLTLTLGPIGFGIENGIVAVHSGEEAEGAAKEHAYLRYGLSQDHYLSDGFSSIISGFALTSAGKVTAELPLTGIDTLNVAINDLEAFMEKIKNGDLSAGGVDLSGATMNVSEIFESLANPLFGVNPLTAILADKNTILNGIDDMFDRIDLAITAADGVLGSMDVPVVKNKIREVIKADFIDNFRITLRDTLSSALEQAGDDSVAQVVRDAMVTLFKDTLGILKGDTIPILIKKEDGTTMEGILDADGALESGAVMDDADAVEWDVTLGKDITFDQQFDFDLGLSELPLELNATGGVNLVIGWDFKLWFGISIARGFYMNVAETEMEFYAKLTLPGLAVTGSLFILEASIVNRDDLTILLGRAAVDVTEPSGDGFLTFKEIKEGGADLLRVNSEFKVVVGMDLTLGLANMEGLPEFKTLIYTYYEATWERKSTKGTLAGQDVAIPDEEEALPSQGDIPISTLLLADVGLDLGEFVTNILNPIFTKLNDFLAPILPILQALQKPLPVISDLAKRDVSLLELPELLINGLLGAGGPVRGSVKNVLGFLNAITEIVDLAIAVIEVIQELADPVNQDTNLRISFGSWKIDSNGFSKYTDDLPEGFVVSDRHAQVMADDNPDEPVAASSQTGTSKMKALFASLTNPDAIFNLPFLSASGVMGLITGNDVDLFVINTPKMEIDVTIDFWMPIAAVIVVDFYGSFQFSAGLSLGYDSSGIRRAIEQNNPLLALDGFFISDTDLSTGTGGVDIPEIYASGTVRVGATLNVLLAKMSGSGTLSFTGSIDLYDPNDDGKIRFSEIKSIIDKGSFLDIFNIKIKMCAGATFSVDIFNPFVNWKCKWYGCWPRGRWESVYRFSVYSCFLELDTTPPALPILAEVESNVLQLNIGPRAGKRETGDTSDKGEYFTISYVSGSAGDENVEVLFGTPPASGQDDNRQAQEFTGFLSYYGDGNKFSDTIHLVNPVSRGTFKGGTDAGYDRLILDFSTFAGAIADGTLTDGQIKGFGMSGDGIFYSEFEEVQIYLNGQANRVVVTGSSAGTTMKVFLNGGNDKVEVTSSALIAGNLEFTGGDGQDTLYVAATSAGTGTLYSTKVELPSMGGTLTYSTMEVIRVTLTSGVDTFVVDSTPSGASVEVQASGGADSITVGTGSLDTLITSPVKVSGSSLANLIINDADDTATGNVGDISSTRITGLGLSPDGVTYSQMASVTIKLPERQPSVFTVSSTHSGETTVTGGNFADNITISGVSGETWINGGDGDDNFEVPVTIEGDTVLNRIAKLLHLDAQNGDDHYSIGFSGTGQSRIHIEDTGFWNNNGAETNTLTISGTAADDIILFRKNFIALMHTDADAAERIDIDRTINGGITVNGLAGDDSFITDGTAGIITQNGGAGDDRFLIGQLYNSLRVAANMSEADDAFDTTLTTEGYLSDGNGEHMNCNGESGADSFIVMRNLGTLSLRGGVDNDRFTVRAFALADAEDQSQPDPALGQTDVGTDEGDDTVYYTVNAPVTIDGGPGFDTLVAIGTEFPDIFVVTRDGIYGAGLYITFVGIESVELNTAGGDDEIFIMSTSASVKTSVYGGLGSDKVYITPRYSVPVSSSDLKGHNGIIEHTLTSETDSNYDGLETHGVTAYITDADNASIAVVVPTEIQVIEESSVKGEWTGVYYLRLGHAITKNGVNDSVTVNIVVPDAPSENPTSRSVVVSPNVITFKDTDWYTAAAITVTVVTDYAIEGNEVVFLGHAVVQLSNQDGYDSLKIPSVPVRVVDADQTELYIVETPDTTTGMRISESGLGTVTSTVEYEVLLRPCVSESRPQDVSVTVDFDAEQVTVLPSTFSFTEGTHCRQTVVVTAVNDNLVEGFHFVALQHSVTVASSNAIYYSADLTLDAVNIEILDNDAPAMAVLEYEGSTTLIEALATDFYFIYLTMIPEGTVTVDIAVALSEVWGDSSAARKQVSVTPQTVVFGEDDYYKPVTISVTALEDGVIDEGETTQQFASQPALAYQIQGSLTVGGGYAEGTITTVKAIMYPGEVDIEAFPGQTNKWLTVREEEQVDHLIVENTGGFLPTTTYLEEGRITGMGMGVTRTLEGTVILGGVSYTGMENVTVNLGPATDTVIVNGTHPGATYVNAGKSDDTFTILGANGPVILNGSTGNDNFTFGAEDGLMSAIQDMVCVDGGEGTDYLWVNNTQGNPDSQAGFLSRTDLTGLGMYNVVRGTASVAVQILAVRGSSGTFGVSFAVDGVTHSFTFNYGEWPSAMEDAMQAAVFPNSDGCGTSDPADGPCSHSFAIDRLPWGYIVRFVGELDATGSRAVSAITLDTTSIVGTTEELLGAVNINSRPFLAGALYVNIETLDIDLATDLADTINIRGTSIPTTVRTHGGDDTIIVASDAVVLNNVDALTVQKVEGRLDYVEALLTLHGGDSGRTRLMVSDTEATTGKTNVELTAGLINNLAPAQIVYSGADYSRGVNVWLSAHTDVVTVSSTYGSEANASVEDVRTITSLFTGAGDDRVTVELSSEGNGFFVVGTEAGNDYVNAATSTLPLVIVGGYDNDTIISGLGSDIIFGDTGNVKVGDDIVGVPAGSEPALSGVLATLTSAFTDHSTSCYAGGDDTITTSGEAGYIIFGGDGVDNITSASGNDLVFGDYGLATYTDGSLTRADSACSSAGGDDIIATKSGNDIIFGGNGADSLTTENGADVVVGDHGTVYVAYPGGYRLVTRVETTINEAGSGDFIWSGSGNDIVVGGIGNDSVLAGIGDDVVFGDAGLYLSDVSGDFTFTSVDFELVDATGATDTLFGEDGDDILIGGQGEDYLSGSYGSDWLFGDYAAGSIATSNYLEPHAVGYTIEALSGGNDILLGEDDADLIMGGHADDTITGSNGADVIFGNYGNYSNNLSHLSTYSLDALISPGSNNITGDDDDDYIFGGSGVDNITGNNGHDWIFGDNGQLDIAWSKLEKASWEEFGITDREVNRARAGQLQPMGADLSLTTHLAQSTDPSYGLADTITGNDGNDAIFGGNGGDDITGNDNEDILFGDHGSLLVDGTLVVATSTQTEVEANGAGDSINGNNGDDVIFGGQGSDNITGNAGNDAVFGDHGKVTTTPADQTVVFASISFANGAADTITTHDGSDFVFGGTGGDSIDTSTEDDVVFGDHGEITFKVVGGNNESTYTSLSVDEGGDDTIVADDGNDFVFGGAGSDDVAGNDGSDVIFGDHGEVTLTTASSVYTSTSAASGSNDTIVGHTGADFIFGGADNDVINGKQGADVIFGDHGTVTLTHDEGLAVYESQDVTLGGDDTIFGNKNDDVIFGGAGADDIQGNLDSDVIFGDHGKVTLSTASSIYESTSASEGGKDTITGNQGPDFVFGGAAGDNIAGNEGADVVFGDHGLITIVHRAGTSTYESIEVEEGGDDTITSDDGNDFVFGGAGGDDVEGNDGSDVVFGDHGKVTLNETASVFESTNSAFGGPDVIAGQSGDDFVFGGADGDNITTDTGNDVVFGDSGIVTLIPSDELAEYESQFVADGGADNIETHSGKDVIFGGVDTDTIIAGTEDDVVFGDNGLVRYEGSVTLYESVATTDDAWGGWDTIYGDAGDDVIFGGQDGDNITGNAGDDWVFGDHGRVVLTPQAENEAPKIELTSISPNYGGSDSIDTHDGSDYVFGGQAGDEITTDTEDDVVFGDHGHIAHSDAGSVYESIATDIDGHGGADIIDSGEHDDLVFGGQSGDIVRTHEGDDTVFGDFGRIAISTGGYPITKVSTAAEFGGKDVILTGTGVDHIFGGADADVINSGSENDVVFGDHGMFTSTGTTYVRIESLFTEEEFNGGDDAVVAEEGDDIVLGGQGNDNITGNSGDDWLLGDQGRIVLDKKDQTITSTANSSGGSDTISGDAGNDYIIGGIAGDTIFGGSGVDFIFGDSGRVAVARTRILTAIFVRSEHGGDDTISAGSEDDFVMGQQGDDTISGDDGMDMIFGDHAEAELLRENHEILWAETTAPVSGRGGDDTIFGGAGEDYLFGGTASDTIHGGPDSDIILGDHALFNQSFRTLHQYQSIYISSEDAGANDTIHGNGGDDFILGQQGSDLIFGGHGEDDITGGHDVLDGADGDDTIHGGDDADVVLGDNGLIDRELFMPEPAPAPVPLTPSPVQRPLFCDEFVELYDQSGTVTHPSATKDKKDDSSDEDDRERRSRGHNQYGPNEHKCWLTTCVGDSVRIEWSNFATERRYDIVYLYTADKNGTLTLEWEASGWDLPESSTYTQDVMVRFSSDGYTFDLGFAFEYTCSAPTAAPPTDPPAELPQMFRDPPPYVHALSWQKHPGAAEHADVVRFVQRYDDVDGVHGDDVIYGNRGHDILHGQRGDDTIDGGAGEDEVYGEQGDDVLFGGPDADIILGDMGHVVRAFTEDGLPRLNPKTGAWHRNVVLEEQAHLTKQWVNTWRDAHLEEDEVLQLINADLLLALGGYEGDGETKKLEYYSTRSPWRTALMGVRLLPSGNDTLHGGDGDDVLIGQRGDDTLFGDDGDDFLYGDAVSSVYHYDSCLPLITTVVRILRVTRDESPWKISLPFYGAVTNIPVWLLPEQSTRATVMRPIDDAALSTLVPEDMMMMLDAVGAEDLLLYDADGAVMRPFVAIVPDVLRHASVLHGNDNLNGGDGNDVVVGDAAFHHALLNLRVKELDEMRERAGARWGEVQFRLARLSTDAGTYQADEGTADSLATLVHSGNDNITGGAGDDTLVGDRLEAFTDVVYHKHFTYTALKQTVKEVMLTYADYELIAVDAQMALYEAHTTLILSMYANRRDGKTAPSPKFFISNDEIDGNGGNDLAVGDALLLMAKGVFLNFTDDSNYFTAVHDGSKGKDDNDFKVLLKELDGHLERHIKRDFWPSDEIDGGNLKKRWEWNSLPYTKWGCDTIRGGDGKDSLLGDYALVVVATFEGAPFHPSTEHGLRSINTALGEHLEYVEAVIDQRVTKPDLKWRVQYLQATSFDPNMKQLSFYHDKGRGPWGNDEPESSSQSDALFGGSDEDMVSGSNGVAVVPMWRQTNSLLTDPIIEPRRAFFSVLDSDHWKRMEAYEKRDRSFDEDTLTGGADRDVFLVQNLKEDSVQDKEHWLDSVYYRPAFAYISGILRDAYATAVNGTCLNELSQDGVIAAKSIHKFLALPVAGWHGIFGVVWSNDRIVEPVYYLQHKHHIRGRNGDRDGHHHHDDDQDSSSSGSSSDSSPCGSHDRDSWDSIRRCKGDMKHKYTPSKEDDDEDNLPTTSQEKEARKRRVGEARKRAEEEEKRAKEERRRREASRRENAEESTAEERAARERAEREKRRRSEEDDRQDEERRRELSSEKKRRSEEKRRESDEDDGKDRRGSAEKRRKGEEEERRNEDDEKREKEDKTDRSRDEKRREEEDKKRRDAEKKDEKERQEEEDKKQRSAEKKREKEDRKDAEEEEKKRLEEEDNEREEEQKRRDAAKKRAAEEKKKREKEEAEEKKRAAEEEKKRDEENKKRAEAEEKKREEEEKKRAEEEEKRKEEEEERKEAEKKQREKEKEEEEKRAEKEEKKRAEEEKKRAEEEEKRREAEEKKRAEEEKKRAEEEEKRRAEEEKKRKDAEKKNKGKR